MKSLHSLPIGSRTHRTSRRPVLVLAGALLALPACNESDGTSSGNNALDDADLVALALSAGALSVPFDPATLDYSVDTLSGVGTTTVTATTSDAGATLAIDGIPTSSGVPSAPVALTIGANLILVEVTSEDGLTVQTYTVAVERHPFHLVSISVLQDSIQHVNQEMSFRFDEEVDFTSVSANTIQIQSDDGLPATGVFELRDPATVVFHPSCPTRDDLSDAGLQAGGVAYTIHVPGRDGGGGNTVRSRSGGMLELTQVRNFLTANLDDAFVDSEPGAPEPVLRPQGSLELSATYLEIGGDPDKRVYFERTPSRDIALSEPFFTAPLNLYGDPSSRIAVMIAFDQPIHPAASNLSLLRLEFQEDTFRRRTIDSRATLVANCAETGAKVRLEPSAILPQGALLVAIVGAGFRDLAGDPTTSTVDAARVPTIINAFTSLVPADEGSDEILEGFDFGGGGTASFEDTEAVFDVPPAEWGDGKLSAAFQFDGTGGPNGNFDWIVRRGENFFFDTTSTPINGGPGGVPVTTIVAVNGVVDLRNFTIEEGGRILVQGPNPVRIQATGEVRIAGTIELSGLNARDVAALNSGHLVEQGGAGIGGGGRGGRANENTSGPTPRGGRGEGPFGQVELGGQGGEMGFSPNVDKNARRPGGGGGGRFTRDWLGTTTFTSSVSLAAGPGGDGNRSSKGAESGLSPARGGAAGAGPFLDGNDGNDFFGFKPVVTNGRITALVRGELPRLWAGHGGGGGGNAGRVFPNPNWNFSSDEKGAGGGGGAGGLHVQALGRIVFGRAGQIVANGGAGGLGENTSFLDHVGGTGGGGSGGHVILESAVAVDFTDGGLNLDQPLRDFVLAAGPVRKTGPTDFVDTCGSSPQHCCPEGCRVNSNGGAGGAGLIQVHVPDPAEPPGTDSPADIRVPAAALLAADVLDQVTSPPAHVLMPSIARRSMARSKWISIGDADRDPSGARGRLRFLFGGTEQGGADDGMIRTVGDAVPQLAPLIQGPLENSTTVAILADGVTIAVRGSSLSPLQTAVNDLYLRTPSLLREFVLRIDSGSGVGNFTVAHAEYDEGSADPGDEELRVTVAGDTGTPRDFFQQHAGEPGLLSYLLIPRFFRVVTEGTESLLPTTAFVRIQFQAAAGDGLGGVDEQNPLVDWTGDIARFNQVEEGALRFFRFQVEFELDAQGQGLSSGAAPVTLDFLRIPFVF